MHHNGPTFDMAMIYIFKVVVVHTQQGYTYETAGNGLCGGDVHSADRKRQFNTMEYEVFVIEK